MSIVASSLIAEVKVTGDTETRQKLGEVSASVDKAGGVIGGLKGAFSGAFAWISEGGLGNVISAFDTLRGAFGSVLQESLDAQAGMAQTVDVLKSTHDASGMTADAIANLAGDLSHLTTFSDDTTQAAENMLLTFTNIGHNVFPQATKTVLDMSQALGQDTKNSAIQLGKALNDPITGITALSRVGVTFDDNQKKLIKTYIQHNELAKAQGVILQELQREFGGSAEAAGKTFAGQMTILNQRIADVKQSIGDALLPIVTEFVGVVSNEVLPVLNAAGDWLASTGVPAFEKFASGIYESVTQSKPFRDILAEIGTDLKIVGSAFQEIFSPIKKTTEAVNPLVAIFQHWKPVIEDVFKDVKILAGDVLTFATGVVDAAEKSGLFQSALQFLHDELPVVGAFLVNAGDAINTNLLPPLESLITNVGSAAASFITWMDESGNAKAILSDLSGAIQITTSVVGTLVQGVSDLIGWVSAGGIQLQVLGGVVAGLGTAFLALKIADTVASFRQLYDTWSAGEGILTNLASAVKDRLAKAVDDFLSTQAPNLKASMDGIKNSAAEAVTAEEAVAAAPADTSAEGWFARLEGSLAGVGTAAETSAGEVAVASTEMEGALAGVGTAATTTEGEIAAVGTASTTAGAGVAGFGAAAAAAAAPLVVLGAIAVGTFALIQNGALNFDKTVTTSTGQTVQAQQIRYRQLADGANLNAQQMSKSADTMKNNVSNSTNAMNKNVSDSAAQMYKNVVADMTSMQKQSIAEGVTLSTGMQNLFNTLSQNADGTFSQMSNDAYDYLKSVEDYVSQAQRDALAKQIGRNAGNILNKNTGYASGTDYVPQTGSYLVGERGPERVVLPRGAAVIPNDQLGRGGSGWGGGGNKQPVHIHVDVGSRELASVLVDDIMDLATRQTRLRYGRRAF